MNVADSGNYIVTIGYTGCQQTTVISKQVFVIAPPQAVINGLRASYCFGDSASMLSGIPSGGVFSGTGISGNVFTPNFTGNSSIKYISPPYYGCAADTATQITTVNSLPSVSITNSGGTFLCTNDTITLTANTTANIFLWSTGATTSSIRVSTPGTYKVTVTNSSGCLKVSSPVQISKDPVIRISSNKGTVICNGDIIQLSFNATNVLWSTGATTPVISLLPAVSTVYYVQGTSVNNCVYQDSIAITVNPNHPPGAVSNMFPPNGSANLTYPINFSWLPGIYNGAFDFYLWEAAQPQPAFPYRTNIYEISTTIIEGLNYGIQYKWRIKSKNGNCADTSGPVQTFTLRNLPDLIVQNITTPPAAVLGGQTISFGWQIKNMGTGGTGSARWVDKIYLSANDTIFQEAGDLLLASHLNFSALNPGQAYSDSLSFTLPINAAGVYYLIIKTDAGNQVLESNEINNTKSSSNPIIVILPPLPDLRVTSVAAQTNIFSGSNCIVTYTIKNFGNAPVNAADLRTDRLYITSNSILDTIGLKVAGSFAEGLALAPGQSRTITVTAIAPKHIYGTYFVHVFTDALGRIFEGPNENNNSNKDSINVFLSPYPDLVVYGLQMNDTLTAGENFSLSYILKNEGLTRTDSAWLDGIFLSRDTIFNLANAIPLKWIFHTNELPGSQAVFITYIIYLNECPYWVQNCHYEYYVQFIGSVPPVPGYSLNDDNALIHFGGLPNGDSLKYNFYGKLPDTLSGNYHVFVVTDVVNSVFEYNKEGNNILRRGNYSSNNNTNNQPVTFLNPDLTVTNVNAPSNANAGSPIAISWMVKNNGPGRLNNKSRKDAVYLSTSSANLNNPIFLGDVEYSTPLQPNEQIELQKTVTLPANLSGTWYVFVKTDYTNLVFENGIENNNIAHSSAMLISLTNWADLVPVNINIPDTLRTTIDYDITAVIANIGSLYANGTWKDALYISKSAVWDSLSSTLITPITITGNVAAGASYTNNMTVSLPLTTEIINGTDSSWYYLYYKVNNKNQLFENGADSNNIIRSDSIFVYNPLVDHIVTSVTGKDSAFSGQFYNVQWTVKNIGEKAGSAYYSGWADGLIFSMDTLYDASDTLIGYRGVNTPLDHNGTYSKSAVYLLANDISGDRYLIEKTDIYNSITGEIVKSNNYNLVRNANGTPMVIHFVRSESSDLEATILAAPYTGIAGQPLDIIYKVKNKGPAETNPGSWIDKLTLSSGYYPGQILLHSNNHTNGLKVDSSYTDSAQVFIPGNALGNYVLVLQTDENNRIYEAGLESNNFSYSLVTVTQMPPCDLIATNISKPDTVMSGSMASVSWHLNNIGVNPALGYLRVAVYLSKDTILDNNDPLVGVKSDTISIASGAFITQSLTANLNGSFGNNHILVRVDLLNNINESNENNNITASGNIFISIKTLPIESPTADTLSNINLMNYKIDVPAALRGETLQVSVAGDTTNGNTELYISYNQIPSTANYQFGDNNPYHKIKNVVIPSLDSGTYYLTVKGTVNNTTSQPVSLLAHILPFEITNIETNHGGNAGNVTVKITGYKFEQGMTVKLKPNFAGADIIATNIIFINSTFIWATFNLAQKPLGVYDVLLRKTNNLEALLDDSFTVEKGNNGTLTIGGGMTGVPGTPGCNPFATGSSDESLLLTAIHPDQERVGRSVPVTILFTNAGNVDIPIPSRLLVSDAFPVSRENYFPNENEPNENQKELLLEFRELNGPPGILRAGASGSVTFFTRIILLHRIGAGSNRYVIK